MLLSGTQFSNFYFALLNYTDTLFSLHSPLSLKTLLLLTPYAFLIIRHYVFPPFLFTHSQDYSNERRNDFDSTLVDEELDLHQDTSTSTC